MVDNGLCAERRPDTAGPVGAPGPPDGLLVEWTRAGDVDAFLELWTRHSPAVASLAARTAPSTPTDPVVAAAFAAVLVEITSARDPAAPFRSLVYKALLRLVGRTGLEDPPPLLRALGHLPFRAQSVLWYRDVEEATEREVTLLVGEEPGEQRAVRRRALAALRTEWAIEKVLDPAVPDMCAWCATRVRARSAGWLAPSGAQRFDRHVGSCADCAEFLDQMDDVARALRTAARVALGGR